MMMPDYVCSVPLFLLTVRTSQKEGQKASLMKYVSVALVCYAGVLVLLLRGRRDTVAKGMKLEEAMDKWQTMDQLPAEYRS